MVSRFLVPWITKIHMLLQICPLEELGTPRVLESCLILVGGEWISYRASLQHLVRLSLRYNETTSDVGRKISQYI